MRSRVEIISTLLLLIYQCFATSCRTCRNKGCQKEIVDFRACTKLSSLLPFESYSKLPKIKEHLHYGCLKLEYLNGNSIDILQKCIITEDINTFCQNIARTVSYTSCKVELPTELKIPDETNSLLYRSAQPTQHQTTFISTARDNFIDFTTPSFNNEDDTTIIVEGSTDDFKELETDFPPGNNPKTEVMPHLTTNSPLVDTISEEKISPDSSVSSNSVTGTVTVSVSVALTSEDNQSIISSSKSDDSDNALSDAEFEYDSRTDLNLTTENNKATTKISHSVDRSDLDIGGSSEEATDENGSLDFTHENEHTENIITQLVDNSSTTSTINDWHFMTNGLNNTTFVNEPKISDDSDDTELFSNTSPYIDELTISVSTVLTSQFTSNDLISHPSTGRDVVTEDLNMVSSTSSVPSNALDAEKTTLPNTDVSSVDPVTDQDRTTHTGSPDHTEDPSNFDKDNEHNSGAKIKFSVIGSFVLVLIYAVG